MGFRTLLPEEIKCRVGRVYEGGCSLYLYFDARTAMNILDDAVGTFGWQRIHEDINGKVYCKVGIEVDGQWIWKEDVGSASYSEEAKGEASDSFKRACISWGIGRCLYNLPQLYTRTVDVKSRNEPKSFYTYDEFAVSEVEYTKEGEIAYLRIINKTQKCDAYVYKRKEK